jgi:hypothetical protein
VLDKSVIESNVLLAWFALPLGVPPKVTVAKKLDNNQIKIETGNL